MPRDDEWGDDWIREDDDWQDPRVDEPTRVDDGWDDDVEELPYDDAPGGGVAYDEPRYAVGPVAGVPGDLDHEDDGYEEEPDTLRRALVVATVALVVLLVGAALAALLVKSGDDSDSDLVADRSSTTTVPRTVSSLGALPGASTSSSSSTSTTAAGGGAASGEGLPSTTSTSRKATTTTSTTQPDDDEPACSAKAVGAAAPGNQPMTVSFCVQDGTPRVGEVVRLYGSADDPDAQIEADCVKVAWQREEQLGSCPVPTVTDPQRGRSFEFSHTYDQPGTYTIQVGALSDDPKGSYALATLKITVHA